MHWIIEQGKSFYWGTSEWPADHIQRAIGICERLCGVWLLYNNVVALIITIFGVAILVAITVHFQLVIINTMKRENSNEI